MTAPPSSPAAAPRLYLVTPPIAQPEGFAPALADALAQADVAAVLLRLAPADERTLLNRIKALAPVAQRAGAALLLEGRAELVARSGADGAHLRGIAEFGAASTLLKPKWIAGCGALPSRHDAMLAAEKGADYVMFGEPEADGQRPSFAAVADRVAWWAEVFETPCVGYAGSLEEVDSLVAAGADFIAAGDLLWTGARASAADLAQRLTGSTHER